MSETFKLVLAEKPSVGQNIAAVFNANERKDGFFIGGGYIVSWCYGHLVDLADPAAYGERYKRWDRAALPILPETWKFTASDANKKQLDVIRGLMNRADVDGIICATDAGREGELIFRLVYDFCRCRKPVQRLWISSLEDSAIREGFANLRPGSDYETLYRAALCRSQADWAVGINATRLFSCLYGVTLNVGRVQSPTLAMIVEREKAAAAFLSEPFYTPVIDCGGFSASGERLDGSEAAEAIRAAADGRDASVLSVEKARKTVAPPKLYDLTTLQRDANRLFGFTAQQTLDCVQSLYEKKLATYPRTDSQYLTNDMKGNASAVIEVIKTKFPFGGAFSCAPNVERIADNSKVSDHHAIIPTLEAGKFNLSALPASESAVMNLIAARLLCATAPGHSFEAITAELDCGGHRFTAKGKTVLTEGWKAVDAAFRALMKNKQDEETDEDEGALPKLTDGQVFPAVKASVREGKTKPPARFTEDSLLRAMETAGEKDFPDDAERKGLGTPATRAGVIEKLVKTGFIERQKKNLVPTEKGKSVIAVLPDDLKSPLLTAEWERKLKQVERGELADAEFMDGIEALAKGLVAANAAPLPEMAALFGTMANEGGKGANAAPKGELVGKCPRCGADVSEGAKGFFCSNRACKFALWKDSRFWAAKGKTLDTNTATALLSEGRVSFSDLKSERTGKTYAATIVLVDDGGKTDFRLEFDNKAKGGGA